MPAIAISTVAPEISTAWPDVARGDQQRLVGVPPVAPLLALPPQVEERVVHADRQADQQDDRADRRGRSGRRG